MNTQKLEELVKGLSQEEMNALINRVEKATDREIETIENEKHAKQQDGLLKQYTEEMVAHRGNKGMLQAIKAKYIKLGLDVDRVVFNG